MRRFLFLSALLSFPLLAFAQEAEGDSGNTSTAGQSEVSAPSSEPAGEAGAEARGEITAGAEEAATDEDDGLNPRTGFPLIKDKPFITFNEGVTFSQVTRIVDQKDYKRSNFVWQDYLIGAFFELETVNMRPCDSLLRIAGYYPFHYTFNGMEQQAKQAILYAVDAYWGPLFKTDMWKYVVIDFSFGPHFLYQLSDEYHHIELGGAVLLGTELPLARRWSILLKGLGSFDYGNLGSNREMNPYTIVYNLQCELGIRYSRKNENKYSYIRRRKK